MSRQGSRTPTVNAEAAERADAARRQTLELMHTRLVDQITALQSDGQWQRWLTFARSFHQYSFLNTLLILSQRPDATAVAGYRAWQAKGRQVRRGEKAIRVYGPVTRRVPVLGPTGVPVLDERGKPRHRPEIVGVTPVSVFDVSQTTGDPIPTQPTPQLLAGHAPEGLWDGLVEVVRSQGFTVQVGPCGDANGLTLLDTKQVRIRADVDDAQAVKTLAHETAHVLLHAGNPGDPATPATPAILRPPPPLPPATATTVHSVAASSRSRRSPSPTSSPKPTGSTPASTRSPTSPGGRSQRPPPHRRARPVNEIITATGKRVIAAADRILTHTQPQPTIVDEAVGALRHAVEHTPPAVDLGDLRNSWSALDARVSHVRPPHVDHRHGGHAPTRGSQLS